MENPDSSPLDPNIAIHSDAHTGQLDTHSHSQGFRPCRDLYYLSPPPAVRIPLIISFLESKQVSPLQAVTIDSFSAVGLQG